ncbi:MAG: DUF1800 family protein [Pseudomonadota bacterium]
MTNIACLRSLIVTTAIGCTLLVAGLARAQAPSVNDPDQDPDFINRIVEAQDPFTPPTFIIRGRTDGIRIDRPQPPATTLITNRAQAARFLMYATFGGSETDIDALVGRDAADWLTDAFEVEPVTFLDRTIAARRPDGEIEDKAIVNSMLWQAMMTSEDQLGMRMTFALSQIFVASLDTPQGQLEEDAYFVDQLRRHAFGHYRDLLEDVTYAPLMGRWLTFLRNRKGNPNTGRVPDENYAREILQLFSIGLLALNRDGTPALDNAGNRIETYDNADIAGLARVFTGFWYDVPTFRSGPTRRSFELPMVIFDEEHSALEKTFLGTTIPENTGGDVSVAMALDTIANHGNVAPFLCRQLIQRFTLSHPSPDYVQRVVTAFERGTFTAVNGQQFGTGVRGDLKATVAAILLDPVIFEHPLDQPRDGGKIREPILKFVQWVRAFDVSGIEPGAFYFLIDTRASDGLGQQFLRPPSVFNFYRPGYVAPQTQSGDQGLTAPELQLVNSSSVAGYLNFMARFVLDRTEVTRQGFDPAVIGEIFLPDYSDELALVEDPRALVDRLDLLLTGRRLSRTAREEIRTIVEMLPIRTNQNEDRDRLRRVTTTILLVMGAPAYHTLQ